MYSNTRPTYELALETTILNLQGIKESGADLPMVLASLKAHMFNEGYLDKSHRQTFLKRVNEALGTGYSMNQVRKADPSLLQAATGASFQKLIPVDELHGEVTMPASDQSNTGTEQSPLSIVATSVAMAADFCAGKLNELEATGKNNAEEPSTSTNTSTLSSEQPTMNAIVGSKAESLTINLNNNTAPINEAIKNGGEALFILDLVNAGYVTPEQRDALYNAFVQSTPELQNLANAHAHLATDGNDARFFKFVSATLTGDQFAIFLANAEKPAPATAEKRSSFSFRGERDESIRSGWVAAGSALVGAALETGHRGELTIGSGLGALAGIVGSYFAAEALEGQIDSQFGRYVAAGTMGLAVGTLGSGVGRLAQTAITGEVLQQTEGSVSPAPTVALPAPADTPAPSFSIAALLGLS